MPEPADQPLLTPAAMLGDRVTPLPKRAVLVFDESHVPRRKRRRDPAPFRQVALVGAGPGGGSGAGVAVVASVGPGGPTAAVTVEFLVHLGVEAIVSVGIAGDLTGDRSHATVFPVSASVAEHGPSTGYGPHRTPNPELLAALTGAVAETPAIAWSTDTPLRHTEADIIRFRASAGLIEMEVATLFAAAHRCDVAAGALLVTSDRYRNTDRGIVWSAGDPGQVRPAVDAAVGTAIEVLRRFPVPSDTAVGGHTTGERT